MDAYTTTLEWALLAAFEDKGYTHVLEWNSPGNTIGKDSTEIIEFLNRLENNIEKHKNSEIHKQRFEMFKKYILKQIEQSDSFKKSIIQKS